MNRDGWQGRIGEIGCGAECYTNENVEEELGPQETLCRSMGKRKQNRCDHDSEWGEELALGERPGNIRESQPPP